MWPRVFDCLFEKCNRAIIDLRGFEKSRVGSAFELFSILQRDNQGKSLFLADEDTNLDDIRGIFESAAASKPGLSSHFADHGLELRRVGRGTGSAAAVAAQR